MIGKKIWLKSSKDLQASKNFVPTMNNIDTITPEKNKKARKVKSVTTNKKNKTDANTVQIVSNKTVPRKKTSGLGLQLGQLRIDSFFKAAAKSFKIDKLSNTSTKMVAKPKKCIKGRKRLFRVESTTSTSSQTDSDVECLTPIKKRTQPKRKVKKVANSSDNDTEVKPVVVKQSLTPKKVGVLKETSLTNVNQKVTDLVVLCPDDDTEVKPVVVKQSSTPKKVGVLKETSLTNVNQKVTPPPPMVSIPNLMTPATSKVNGHAHNSSSSNQNDPTERSRKRRPCPPYKIVEGTTFAVDAFQFGELPNVTLYFLTHYHADHYIGLTRKFAHPLYMSPITARLVRTFIPIDEQYIHEINIDEPIMLNNIEVTAIDANHCPGAIMLIFKIPSGKCILHTGDFRFSFEMESLPIFWNEYIDLMYLDTTYLSKKYNFCHQSESIERAIRLVKLFREKHITKKILYVFGSYIIGKEKIWLALANEFGFNVWTEPHRQRALDCLGLPDWEKRKCNNPHKADLHILGMGVISYPRLAQYLEQYPEFDMLFAIRPSGWEKNSKPKYGKRISIIGIEYSEHSSYEELERFVRFLKPKRVISTVPVGPNLFITGDVPKKWYQYKNAIIMTNKEYQPRITSFFKASDNPMQVVKQSEAHCMMMSPLQTDSIKSLNEDCLQNEAQEANTNSNSKIEPAVVYIKQEVEMDPESPCEVPTKRFISDASDDMLI